MINKQLVVKSQRGFVDVWYATLEEILETCKNLTGACIKKISISDEDYPSYPNHCKDFLNCGHKEGWHFSYNDPKKSKQIEESCTAFPLEESQRACRVACEEFRIFNDLEEAINHAWTDTGIIRALEVRQDLEKESWYEAIR